VIYEISLTAKNKKFVVTNAKQKRTLTPLQRAGYSVGYMVNPFAWQYYKSVVDR
jgi:hypothetical protein